MKGVGGLRKKTLSKYTVLEKIAFGYVLIERENIFPWKKKSSKQFAIKTHSLIRKDLRYNLGH